MSVTRREFLSVGGSAVVFLAGWPSSAAADCAVIGDRRLLTPWIAITQASRIVVLVDKCEMGQGVRDLFARVVADELDVVAEDVLVDDAPVDRAYGNTKFPIPVLRFQVTGYSSSTADAYEKLTAAARQTGQALRHGAAEQLKVWPDQLVLHDGWVVTKDTSGRRVTYAEAVGWIPTATTPPREDRRPGRVGAAAKRAPRIDARDKVTGNARYGIDVDATELCEKPLVALVLRPGRSDSPFRFGVDHVLALRLDGVKHVCEVQGGHGIAVVADSFWRANRARAEALQRLATPVTPDPSVWASSEATIAGYAREASSSGDRGDRQEGNSLVVDRVYETPYGPHAPLEPMTASCRKNGNVYDIWAATQFPEGARARVAHALCTPVDNVVIHGMLAGGSFGRRVASDFIVEVAEICRAIGGRAVKLIWTRDEDFRHDYLRPCAVNRVRAKLTEGSEGRITEWTQHVGVRSASVPLAKDFALSTPFGAVLTRAVGFLPAVGRTIQHADGLDPTASEGISDSKYDMKPSIHILKGPGPKEIWRPRVGYWRSVNFFHTIFAVESTIDDLAAAGSRNPAELRQGMLAACPRLKSCLDWVAKEMAKEVGEEKFRRPAAAGRRKPAKGEIGHGLACYSGFGSFAALAVTVSIDEGHGGPQIRVGKAMAAVDCGRALYPDVVEQQVEGGIIFGLSAALKQDITIVDGVVQQQNFDQRGDILRMHECPEIVVKCLDGGPKATPTGVGELMVPLVAPAVANAIFNLTGTRLLRLPLTPPRWPA